MPEETASPLAKFDPSEAHLQAYRGEIAAIVADAKQYRDSKEPTLLSSEQLAKITPSKRQLVKMRNQIENGRLAMFKEERRKLDEAQGTINAAAKKLQSIIETDEAILTEAIGKHERIEKAAAEAKVRAEEEAKAAEAKKVADALAEINAERKRQEEERLAAERKKLAEERAAFEADMAKARSEAESLRSAQEIERKKMADEQAAMKAERDKLALEKWQEEKRVELAEAARVKAEKDAAERESHARIAELNRIAKEQEDAAQAEAERKEAEAAKPDRERVKRFGQMLGTWVESNQPAAFQSKPAKEFVQRVMTDLRKIVADCKSYTSGKGAKS